MADRLQELLQQRALIKEHLAWIEGEIAAASGCPIEPALPYTPVVQPVPLQQPPSRAAVVPAPVVTGPRLRDDEDSLIARLAAEERNAPVPTKKGCWVFFWITLAALAAAAWAMIRFFYRE